MKASDSEPKRETFASNFGLLMTMIGVAVGLGNVWRFPYMVGKFGGAAFVFFYLLAVFVIGIPAMMAEWTLGRYTRRGTLGAFKKGGFPGGKYVGAFFFFIVICATGYYSVTLGWVAYYALGEIVKAFGRQLNTVAILPPAIGFNLYSFLLQLLMTSIVIFTCGIILVKGLRKGIEKVSKFIMPSLLVILIILIIRAITLEGASEGLKWYIGGFRFRELTGSVMAAALGQAVFSMSLGGTFMVIYGSYLDKRSNIPKNAIFTGVGDTVAGLLAGFAIFPAVFAFGLEPASGPSLIFSTLPKTFAMMPAGWLFGLIFFLGLFGAAYLSDVAAFEVLVGGIVDNTKLNRKKAVLLICTIVFVFAIPPLINFKIFFPWDLTFGSGMQTVGALLAVITTVWCIKRSEALKELSEGTGKPFPLFLYWWMRIVIPLAILFVGINWLLEFLFR
ncbi:MAG: sodium-dependent transporter [Candidatus Aminicenantes bacterium]|nr:sodium-dependent transporter [Candidatus Aminicenantes bacterium]